MEIDIKDAVRAVLLHMRIANLKLEDLCQDMLCIDLSDDELRFHEKVIAESAWNLVNEVIK